MNEEYLMAIDAGTGSVRVVIFDTKGHQISVGQREWSHHALEGVDGSMDFDLITNWDLTSECIKEAILKSSIEPSNIKAISSCSMREGIVVYDKNLIPIWACANVDSRAGEESHELKQLNNGKFEEIVYKKTGQTFALGAAPRLLWLKKNRTDIYERIASMSMISDWIGYKLCGKVAVDPSNAGTTGLLSLFSREWETDLLSESGIKPNILPPVLETGSVLGGIIEKASIETGLLVNTPFIVGGGDVQLGCLGLGVVRPNQAAVLGGTFWQQVVNLPEPIVDPTMNVRVNPHVIPNLAQAESISFFTGLVMRWFRDVFCSEEKKLAVETGIDAYTILEDMARNVPVGAYGIIPIFSDAMHYKKWYHASPSFLNMSLDPERCNKASMFRALEENAAIVSAINLKQVFDFSGATPDYIVFAAGGSNGKLWSQILSDVTGREVRVPVIKEATALGCAIAAGVGAGIYSDLASISEELVQWEFIYQPDMNNYTLYQEVTENWITSYKAQLKLVDNGLTTSLWKAPDL